MKLTALEIKQQKFEKAIRGYDKAEVQAFLNLISNEWEHLVSKNRELEKQIETLEGKLKHYEKVEEALHETLQTAKNSAEQKLSGARNEARNKIEKAEIEAQSIIREATQQRQQVRQSVIRLLDRRKEIIGGIRSYLELARESLEQFSEDEAALFTIPADDNPISNNLNNSLQKKKFAAENSADFDEDSPLSPGAENVDDIIDELD
ncbi:MAG TPA: DivIVA domain-containing protein [Balneolaceae bacterium]